MGQRHRPHYYLLYMLQMVSPRKDNMPFPCFFSFKGMIKLAFFSSIMAIMFLFFILTRDHDEPWWWWWWWWGFRVYNPMWHHHMDVGYILLMANFTTNPRWAEKMVERKIGGKKGISVVTWCQTLNPSFNFLNGLILSCGYN